MCNHKDCNERQPHVKATIDRILAGIKAGTVAEEDRKMVHDFFQQSVQVLNALPQEIWMAAASGEVGFAAMKIGGGAQKPDLEAMLDTIGGGAEQPWPGKPSRKDN